MFDWIAVLESWLDDQSTLTDQVSTRIWRGGVPQAEQSNMPQKALALISEPTGASLHQIPLIEVALQARCYGGTDPEAVAVATALYSVMHRITAPFDITYSSSDYRVYEIWSDSPGYRFPEPEMEWPLWIAPYTLTMAEGAV